MDNVLKRPDPANGRLSWRVLQPLHLNPALLIAIVMEEVKEQVPDTAGDAEAVERSTDEVVAHGRGAGVAELGRRAVLVVDAQPDGSGFACWHNDTTRGKGCFATGRAAPCGVIVK